MATQDISAPLEHEGAVTQAVVPPAITGSEITRIEGIKGLVPRAIEGLASGVGALGGALSKLASDASPEPTQPLVTRDQNGRIQVQPQPSLLFGPGGRALANATYHGAVAQGGTMISEDMAKLHAAHLADPEGFNTAAQGYIDQSQGGFGGGRTGAALTAEAQKQRTEIYNGLVLSDAARQVKGAQEAIQTRIGSLSQEMYDLASQGATATPDFVNRAIELRGQYDALANNAAFGYPRERADADFMGNIATFRGAALVGQVDRDFNTPGVGAVGASQRLHDAIGGEPDLSEQQRLHFLQLGQNRIAYDQGLRADDIAANRKALAAAIDFANRPGNEHLIPPGQFQTFVDTAERLGDNTGAQQGRNAILLHPFKQSSQGLAPAQINAVDGMPQPGMPAPAGLTGNQKYAFNWFTSHGYSPNAAHAMVATLTGESGRNLNTGAYQAEGHGGVPWEQFGRGTTAGEAASGIANWNFDRSRLFLKWATANGLNPNSMDAQLRYVDIEARGRGLPVTSNENPAALTTLFTGKFEGPAVNNGAERWRDYAHSIGGAGIPRAGGQPQAPGPPSVNGVSFTWQQMQDNPSLWSDYVRASAADQGNRERAGRSLGNAMEASLSHGVAPPAADVRMYDQLSAGSSALAEQRERLGTKLEAVGQPLGAAASGVQPGGGQPLLATQTGGRVPVPAAAVGGAHTGQPDSFQTQLAVERQSFLDARERQLKAHPAETAAQLGWTRGVPAPIDYNDPRAIAAGIAVRGGIVQAIANHGGAPAGSAILPPDEAAANNVISYGSPDQKLSLLSAVTGLPSPIREETFAKLAGSGNDGGAFAQAGTVARFNPDAAKDILQGAALLAKEPRYAPKPEDLSTDFAKSLPVTDMPSAGYRGRVLEAAKDWYAAQQAKAGKTDQVPNEALWSRALDAVTGGVVDYRGSKVIVPEPGMTAAQFADRVNALTDADMPGATIGGQPFPAAALKASWSNFLTSNPPRLISANPDAGSYWVVTGDPAVSQKVLDANGNKLLLNLRASSMPRAIPPPNLFPSHSPFDIPPLLIRTMAQ